MATERSLMRASFSVERVYDASPSRVFAAFSDPVQKARWFHHPDESRSAAYELDFRVGGHELNRVSHDGTVYTYDARFYDIVPDVRIVSAYEMHLDDARISVSLACFEFFPEGSGTRLTLTEDGAFLDGLDKPEFREGGSAHFLEALAAHLQREPASV